MSYMFASAGLTSLPDSFTIPGTVTNAAGMFSGCNALTALPSSFAIPDALKNQSIFAYTGGDPATLNTTYAGSDPVVRNEYNWAGDERVLVETFEVSSRETMAPPTSTLR